MTKSVQSTPTPFDFNGFQGFAYPNTTQVPDLLFDQIMQDLDEKELKVVLYIIRRTFGFKKQVDNISLSQLVNGIITHDGRILDRGTGLSKATVVRALNSLKQKKLINAIQNRNRKKGNLPTTYSLKMSTDPCLSSETRVVSSVKQGLVSQVRHTTNSNTTNSQTAAKANKSSKVDDSSSDNGDLAAVLIKRGIEEKVARQLTKTYEVERIENNLDWFDWKQKNEPHSIKTNPAGLLRRAIEQDYAAEDHKGFQTRQQKAAALLTKKQRLKMQERTLYARKRQQEASLQQQETARVKRLETLREQYHTSEQEDGVWAQVMKILKTQVPSVSFKTYLSSSILLAMRKGKAHIAVPNRFVKAQIEDRLSKKIQHALGQHLKTQVVTIECLTLDE